MLAPIVNVEDDDGDLSLEIDVFDMLVSSFQGSSSATKPSISNSNPTSTSTVSFSYNPAIATAFVVAKSILETIPEEPEELDSRTDKQASAKWKEVANPLSPVLLPLLFEDCPRTPPLPPASDEGYNVESMIITPCVLDLVEDTTRVGTSLE